MAAHVRGVNKHKTGGMIIYNEEINGKISMYSRYALECLLLEHIFNTLACYCSYHIITYIFFSLSCLACRKYVNT